MTASITIAIARIANPDILLTHNNIAGVILARIRLTPLLKNSHQLAEPVNIPSTTIATDLQSPPLNPPLRPIKMAAKNYFNE